MKPIPCGVLKNLAGMKAAVVDCYPAKTRSGMMKLVRQGNAAVAEGRGSMIVAWWPDDNILRGELWRHGGVAEAVRRETLDGLSEWLRVVWPEIATTPTSPLTSLPPPERTPA